MVARLCTVSCIGFLVLEPLFAEALPEALGSWSPVVRDAAVKKVGKAGPGMLPELEKALGSDNAGLRQAAVESITLIARASQDVRTDEWQTVTSKLVRMVGDDGDFWVRRVAATALKVLRPPAAAPALIKAATDANPWVAAAAVDAISGMPKEMFDSESYFTTAIGALKAPRSETRSSAIKMIARLGGDERRALPAVEASVASYSQDSMFADRPRMEAIVWIAKFDRRKAAALANGLLLEDRWGKAGRYRKLIPFLQTLGSDAAPATEGLKRVATQTQDKGSAAKARKILTHLKS